MATLFEQTGFNASDGWNNFTARVFIPSSFLSGTASAVQVKLAYYNTSWSFGKVYIGHKASSGDAYDFDGNQVQLLFSGSASGTVGSGGLLSDTVTFDFDSSKDILISFYLPSSITVPKLSISNIIVYGKADVDEAATTNITSYTGYTSQLQMVEGIYSATAPLTAEISDNATASDSFNSLIDGLSESSTVDDTITAGFQLSSEIADNTTVSDAFELFPVYPETVEESLDFGDADETILTMHPSISDNLDLIDSNLCGLVITVIDTLFSYDQSKVGWRVTAESELICADDISTVLRILVDEWLTLAETITENWSGQEIIDESITLYDTITAIKTFSDTLTDTIDITDSTLFQLIVTILDVLGFTDLASAVRSSAASISESVALTDSSDLSLPVSATSELSLIDTSSVIASFIHSLQSDLGLADTSSLIARLTGSVTESISFAETVSNKGTYYSAVYDMIAMNVSISLNNEIWECYVLNTPKFYPSMYSGFDFNSFCIYEDRAFGANATGIFELTGITDAGSEIHTGVIFSRTDFDLFNQKKFRKGYLDVSGTSPKIVLETDRDQRQAYTIDIEGKVTISSELKSKTWKLSIADFDSLDGLSLIPIILTR